MTDISLWWDRPAHLTMKSLDTDMALIQSLGLSRVAVMINDDPFYRKSDPGFDMDWFPYDHLKVFSARLKDIDVGLVLTSWLHPRPEYIDGLLDELPPIAMEFNASIEFDTEGNVQENDVAGYKNLSLAVKDLLQGLKLFREMGGKVGITPHTGYIPKVFLDGFPDDGIPGVDEVALQCYSHWSPKKQVGPNYAWGGIYSPGRLQKLGLQKLDELNFKGHRALGLAAYKQKYPNHTEREAMQLAWDAAAPFVPEIRYWSRQNLGVTDIAFIQERS